MGSFFFTEIRAGLATFFAMAYIIAVNGMPEPKTTKNMLLTHISIHHLG
jgi:xanthine/uracil/vitamin C permease (AzgA family)